jgi:L-asparagine transporter-like permease
VSIGTGLLVESGNYLELGGSVSLWLAYLLMGSVVAAVMVLSNLKSLLICTVDFGGDDFFSPNPGGRLFPRK